MTSGKQMAKFRNIQNDKNAIALTTKTLKNNTTVLDKKVN